MNLGGDGREDVKTLSRGELTDFLHSVKDREWHPSHEEMRYDGEFTDDDDGRIDPLSDSPNQEDRLATTTTTTKTKGKTKGKGKGKGKMVDSMTRMRSRSPSPSGFGR